MGVLDQTAPSIFRAPPKQLRCQTFATQTRAPPPKGGGATGTAVPAVGGYPEHRWRGSYQPGATRSLRASVCLVERSS
jgi:hypothetical protein